MKTKIFISSFILLIIIGLGGCNKESLIVDNSQERLLVNQVEFSLELVQLESVIKSEKIVSGQSKLRSSEDNQAHIIVGKIKNPNSGENSIYQIHLWPDSKYVSTFLKRLEKDNWDKIKEEFSGVLIAFSLDNGDKVFSGIYKRGEVKYVLYSPEDIAARYQPIDCVEHIYTVTTHHYTDWYVNGSYVGTSYDGSTTESYSYYTCSGGSSDPDPGGGGSTTSTTSEDLEAANYSPESFCFDNIGSSWTAVTTNIKFKWSHYSGTPPARTIYVSITVTVPEERFDGTKYSESEAQNAAIKALNRNHTAVLAKYGTTRSWNEVGEAVVAEELSLLMEAELRREFGYAKVNKGNTASGVTPCKAI